MSNRDKSKKFIVIAILALVVFGWGTVSASMMSVLYIPIVIKSEAVIQPTAVPTQAPTIAPTQQPNTVFVLPNSDASVSPGGTLHITGEVQNNTNQIINNVQISAVLFDSGHNLIGTQSNSIYLGYLKPGEKSCFILPFSGAMNNMTSYEFETPIYYTTNSVVDNLTVMNSSGSLDSMNWYHLIGQVRNDNAFDVISVRSVGTLYVGSKVAGCYFTYVNSVNLASGQVSAFDILFYSRDYSDVTSYRLQASGIR